MESIEIEGASLEEAVERACNALNTTEECLHYEILDNDAEGARRSKSVKIRASKREGEGEVELSEFALNIKEKLEVIVKEICAEYSVTVFEYPDKVVCNIKGDGSGLLIGKRGQTLDAIQHILIKIANRGKEGQNQKKIIVDTEKYREKRIDYLKDLAEKLADKVKRTGRSVAVNPMSSFERRIIHVTLDKVEGIYTESQGEGPERKVIILPKNNKRNMGKGRRNY